MQKQIQIVLNDMLYHISVYINFYSHGTKENHKSIQFLSTLVGLAGRQFKQGRSIFDVGLRCKLMTFLVLGLVEDNDMQG